MQVVDVLTDRLRVLMKEHGIKAAPLARRANLNESAVRDILRGRSKNPGIVTLTKIASVLSLRASALYEEEETWPVVGQVEADGGVTFLSVNEAAPNAIVNPFFDLRARPYGALAVRGQTLAPLAFEGDYLIFDRTAEGVRDADIGRPCVCTLQDGRMVVRATRAGDGPGKIHLAPIGPYGASEANASVRAATRIVLTLPPAFVPNVPEPTHHAPAGTLHEKAAAYSAE